MTKPLARPHGPGERVLLASIIWQAAADVRRGALFSFARDLSSSANIASVKGAIIRPINLASPDSPESRVQYLLPSLTVNLLSDDREKNQDENVDTLSFRLAFSHYGIGILAANLTGGCRIHYGKLQHRSAKQATNRLPVHSPPSGIYRARAPLRCPGTLN